VRALQSNERIATPVVRNRGEENNPDDSRKKTGGVAAEKEDSIIVYNSYCQQEAEKKTRSKPPKDKSIKETRDKFPIIRE